MREIKSFARLLNAKSFLVNMSNQDVTPIESSANSQCKLVKKFIPKFAKYPEERYQSLNFNTGSLLFVKISDAITICLLFDFNQLAIVKNQFNLIYTLTKLTPISQIIFRLYTAKKAPHALVFVHNSTLKNCPTTDKQHTSPDCAVYYHLETDIIKAIVYSNKDNLMLALEKLSKFDFYNMFDATGSSLRQKQNFVISYIAVLTRAINQWGFPINRAYRIQTNLVAEIEKTTQFPDFMNTIRGLAWFFFKTIKAYRINNLLPLASRIKSYIDEHICDNILLSDIAQAVHASKKNLNPAFKAEFGMTIIQFIRSRKIDRAKEMLLISDITIPEIADNLSFSTPSYFIKTFKSLTGMTPNYFRNNYLSIDIKKPH